MKNHFLTAWCALCVTNGLAQPPNSPSAQTIPTYGAAPSDRQLRWHELEVYGMVNFSTITYYGKEWGYGDEDPSKFNPTRFDAAQIVRAAKAGGLKGLIIDAKHHGGFCLWPSQYNDNYTIRNCPWRGGNGDMVKELADACRAEGLQVAMYLSPWDRHHKDYGTPAYVSYYHQQWQELMTNYGPLFEVWFDGANGGDGWYGGAKETRTIDRKTYYRFDELWTTVRELQPSACIFSDVGPDARWNGNESGISGETCWATLDTTTWYPGNADSHQLNRGHRDGAHWIPAEADFPLRLHPKGWFWHPGAKPATPAELVDIYFKSVGRNSSMDIGIAPDRRGLICDDDVAALRGFGDRIRAIFATNLALTATVTAGNVRAKSDKFAASNILNGRKTGAFWATDDGITDPEITLDFGKPTTFSVISLREHLPLGQRIDRWQLDSWDAGSWREFASGNGIGSRRLWRGQPVTTTKLRLRISHPAACPALSEFAVYLEPESSRTEAGKSLNHNITGLDKSTWKIASASSEGAPARCAIDNNPATFWHTHTTAGRQPPPQEIVVDMGTTHDLTGFLYTPREDNCTVGNVSRYAFYVSADGKTWNNPAATGEFGNIKASPDQQQVMFAKPVCGRFFKFVALASADGACANAAEIGVLGR